ncbi:MAG: DNA alkylation repair protein [Chitinophagales bacterium]|nr:DNA alkylation repair protein [Bacteroidota bacterium]
MQEILAKLTQQFSRNAHDELARGMEAYMKNRFVFYGIQAENRRKIATPFLLQLRKNYLADYRDIIWYWWQQDQREQQYTALDFLSYTQKLWNEDDVYFIEQLIVEKSWWDTVDGLATNGMGFLLKKFPHLFQRVRFWAESDNMWLQRTAIIFQMKYKLQTQQDVLYQNIEMHAHSKEFFIQKAIGWSLREYAKYNPESVRQFVQTRDLPALSIREVKKTLKSL